MAKAKPAPAAEVQPAAERYTVSALRENCLEVLDVEQSTFDGAFGACSENETFTLEEAKGKLRTWLRKPVRIGGRH